MNLLKDFLKGNICLTFNVVIWLQYIYLGMCENNSILIEFESINMDWKLLKKSIPRNFFSSIFYIFKFVNIERTKLFYKIEIMLLYREISFARKLV